MASGTNRPTMRTLLLTLTLSVCAWGASAQPSRVFTLVSKGLTTNFTTVPPAIQGKPATFSVATNEAVRVVTIMSDPADSAQIIVQKSGVTMFGRVGDVVAGPALVSVTFTPSAEK